MPLNSKVHRLYAKLKEKGFSEESAAKIAQKKTGLALATGKPPMHKYEDEPTDENRSFDEINKDAETTMSGGNEGIEKSVSPLILPKELPIGPPAKNDLDHSNSPETVWAKGVGGFSVPEKQLDTEKPETADIPNPYYEPKKNDMDNIMLDSYQKKLEKYCKLGMTKEHAHEAIKYALKYSKFDDPVYTDPDSPFYMKPAETVVPEIKPADNVNTFINEKGPSTDELKSIEAEPKEKYCSHCGSVMVEKNDCGGITAGADVPGLVKKYPPVDKKEVCRNCFQEPCICKGK